jgi:hypothetical protein
MREKGKRRPERLRGRMDPCLQSVTRPIEPGWRRTSLVNQGGATVASATPGTTRGQMAAVVDTGAGDAGVPRLGVDGTLVGAVAGAGRVTWLIGTGLGWARSGGGPRQSVRPPFRRRRYRRRVEERGTRRERGLVPCAV